MAGKKETPRQKLIGMLYLVLMALLALNVSVEVLDSFVIVDEGLGRTIDNFMSKNELTYREFDQRYAENPERVETWREKAQMVREEANKLYDYIEELKVEIVTTAEGQNTEAVVDGIVLSDKIMQSENLTVPGQVMLGAQDAGKARDLKNAIEDYRDFLKSIVDEEYTGVISAVETTLDTSDPPPRDGATPTWETKHFSYIPMIAVMTLMTKMQGDVRNAEAEVINHLLQQIDAGSFMFNALEATVIQNTNHVLQGNEYEAEVFLAAFDTTQAPEVLIGQYETITRPDGTVDYQMVGRVDTLPVSQGRGIYRIRPGRTGHFDWGGLVRMRAADGSVINRPFSSSYQVADPSLVVSPTRMNVFYQGLENPVEISIPGVPADQVTARINNGTIRRVSGTNYIVSPETTTRDAVVSVTATINGETRSLGSRDFRVRSVPDPVAAVGGRKGGNINRELLAAQTGVVAEMEGFEFDLTFTVQSFTVSTVVGGFVRDARSNSNRITDEQRTIIQNARPNQRIWFDDIMAVGPDGSERRLPSLGFRIN